tara:strand:+ start:322 stop:531 length:210 start_codon:yes stop_codon:yes gene_type:complete
MIGKTNRCLLGGVVQERLQEEAKVRKNIPDVCRRYKINGIIKGEKNEKVVDHLDVEEKIHGDQEKKCLL